MSRGTEVSKKIPEGYQQVEQLRESLRGARQAGSMLGEHVPVSVRHYHSRDSLMTNSRFTLGRTLASASQLLPEPCMLCRHPNSHHGLCSKKIGCYMFLFQGASRHSTVDCRSAHPLQGPGQDQHQEAIRQLIKYGRVIGTSGRKLSLLVPLAREGLPLPPERMSAHGHGYVFTSQSGSGGCLFLSNGTGV
jgi:hypothetical protein